MINYGPLVTSTVAGQQLDSPVSTGNALVPNHRRGLKATPTVV